MYILSSKLLNPFERDIVCIKYVSYFFRYYMNGRTASSSDFLDPDIFNLLGEQLSFAKQIVRETGMEGTQLWLGIQFDLL